VLLDLGLRREQFTNYTSTGDAFISQRNMIAPRLGATWDYAGDGSLKLFANAGRYHLPVPSNLSSTWRRRSRRPANCSPTPALIRHRRADWPASDRQAVFGQQRLWPEPRCA
jgi:hypothetical protein